MSSQSENGLAARRVSYAVPDTLDEPALAARFAAALAGGTSGAPTTPRTARNDAVIWTDAGGEVLVHVASVQARIVPNALVVSVDLESDQTGRAPVIVRFVFGNVADPAGLVASTDELPHGDPALVGRWGHIVRDVLWAALVGLVDVHARERGLSAQAIHAVHGHLRFRATSSVPLATRILETMDPRPPVVLRADEGRASMSDDPESNTP